ncbi:hypothetical protein [Caudoviricetes sp.]|nr:hypothetical protein [Caudoviricetes sp.]
MTNTATIFKGNYAKLLAKGGIEFVNNSHFDCVLTLVALKAKRGDANSMVYCVANRGFYQYCASCTLTSDDDIVTTTGDGGNTRWVLADKVSRNFGDTGWIDSSKCSISKSGDTLTLTIATGGATYAIKGIQYQLAAGTYTNTPTGAAGARYFYLDTAGTLKSSDSFFDFLTQTPVAFAQWSGTAISFEPATEFHGIRDIVWHYYTHRFFGSQYLSGLTATYNKQTDNNVNPADATVEYAWFTDGVIYDEDAQITVGLGTWLQTLGSGLTSSDAAVIPFIYYNGSNITAVAAMADRTPFIYTGANGAPQWNNGGTLTAGITGDYVVYHYFASPLVNGYSLFARPHNAVYSSLAAARAANVGDLVWSGFPSAEVKHLYTMIFRVNTTVFTNATHRSKLVDVLDVRARAGSPVAAISGTDHQSLSNRSSDGAHPASAIYGTNDRAIQFHDSATGGLLDSANFKYTSSGNVVLDTGNFVKKVTTITASANMLVTDSVVLCNHASVAITYTLLPASGENRGPITIKSINDAIVTIDGDGSETIDGALTVVLPGKYSSVTICSNGTSWFIL